MRDGYLRNLLIGYLLLITTHSAAVHAQEFRRVTLTDGSVHRGIVKAGDAENLVLETLDGDVALPIMDIVQIEPVDRETLLHETDGYLLCLPLPRGTPAAEGALAQRLCLAMRRDLLQPVPVDHLPEDLRQRLRACHDLGCSAQVASEIDAGYLLETQVSSRGGGFDVSASLYRVAEGRASPAHNAKASIPGPDEAGEAVARCARILLGEEAPAVPVPEGVAESGPEVAPGPESPTEAPGTAQPGQVEEAGDEALQSSLKKYDYLPVPGLAGARVFGSPGGTIVATGAVAAVTGLTVYVVGDLRVVGADKGLAVPWTYEERGIKDAALLTGTGVATYCLTTWAANVLVRKYFTRWR